MERKALDQIWNSLPEHIEAEISPFRGLTNTWFGKECLCNLCKNTRTSNPANYQINQMLFSYGFFCCCCSDQFRFFYGFNLCYCNQYFIISRGALNCILIPRINKVNVYIKKERVYIWKTQNNEIVVQGRPVNTNLGLGSLKTNRGPEPVNTNWGPGLVYKN